MKCVQNKETKEVRRLSDKEADQLVDQGGWTYITKSVWRDLLKVPIEKKRKEP